MTTPDLTAQPAFNRPLAHEARASLPVQIALVTWRNLITIFRTPVALVPPLVISIFFLVIYESTLGKAAAFIPNLSGNSYLGFILPLSIISSSLSGSGIAAQNMVRDIESGYFDKLLLTPVSRTALLLGPILAGALILGIQASVVIAFATLMGLQSATGIAGLAVVVGLAILLGTGFAGFTVSAALGSGSAAGTQGAGFLFFPLAANGRSPESHHLRLGGDARFAEYWLGHGRFNTRCRRLPHSGRGHVRPCRLRFARPHPSQLTNPHPTSRKFRTSGKFSFVSPRSLPDRVGLPPQMNRPEPPTCGFFHKHGRVILLV